MVVSVDRIALYRAREEIEAVIDGFEACTLPRGRWTHGAHLTVALWYLTHNSRPHAESLMRDGIKRYNRASGIVTTREGGYHETMTLFWLRVVNQYLASRYVADCSLVTVANKLLVRLANKNLPLQYYSRERLMSAEAREKWLEPDLRPLEESGALQDNGRTAR
jgi:hypothetical protein